MRNMIVDYILPFLLFLSAIFILCYRFKKEHCRVFFIIFFVVVCIVRLCL